jgi:site-specific DNA-methyltransferase (adenine-specific)
MNPYYYERDGITLYHGDCRDILPHLPKVDLVLTDPPYGIAHPTNYKARGRSVMAECRDYVPVYEDDKPFDPSIWLEWPCLLFGANYFAHQLPPVSGWVIWDKMRPEDLDQSTAEIAWSNFVRGVRVFRHLWHGCMRASHEALQHPTQKPEALMRWIMRLRWTPEGTVLDPYMGSGTTLVAAKQTGRKAIGIEIEERYCAIAAARLEAERLTLFEAAPQHEQLGLM